MQDFDFETDLKQELIRVSSQMGFKINKDKNIRGMLLDYLTVRTKVIEPVIRKVYISPGLNQELPTHPKKTEILSIIGAASRGDNLNHFQSKRLFQTSFHDHLRNEWDIYHFHLSLQKDKKSRFVKQVDWLLFAYINTDTIIFLGTDKHREGIFGDVKWVEILHEHFPDAIKEFKDDKIKDTYPKVNAKERQIIWNKGYTLGFTQVKKDVVYHNPGVGRSVSGHGTNVTTTTGKVLRWVFSIKEQVKDCYKELCEYLELDDHDAQFKIRIGKQSIELIEAKRNYRLLSYPEVLIEKSELIKRIEAVKNI